MDTTASSVSAPLLRELKTFLMFYSSNAAAPAPASVGGARQIRRGAAGHWSRTQIRGNLKKQTGNPGRGPGLGGLCQTQPLPLNLPHGPHVHNLNLIGSAPVQKWVPGSGRPGPGPGSGC